MQCLNLGFKDDRVYTLADVGKAFDVRYADQKPDTGRIDPTIPREGPYGAFIYDDAAKPARMWGEGEAAERIGVKHELDSLGLLKG